FDLLIRSFHGFLYFSFKTIQNLCIFRFSLMLKRMNNYVNIFQGLLGTMNNIKIIKWMRDNKMMEYGDVKWDELSNFLGNAPPFLVQNRFIAMKMNIPNWKELRLYEIVNYLCSVKLPRLEDKLSAAQEFPIEPETKDEFLFSEMFQEYSELEAKWEAPDVVRRGGLCGVVRTR
ncbi:hypothetical protein GDO78_021003, partial [Eleutherodactylus coqui]